MFIYFSMFFVKYLSDTYKEKLEMVRSVFYSMCEWTETTYKSYDLFDLDDKYAYVRYATCVGEERAEGFSRYEYEISEGKANVKTETVTEVKRQWLTLEEEKLLDERRTQFEQLVEYKNNKEKEERNRSYSEIIAKFADLGEVEEYKTLVGKAMEIPTAEELEEKLFAIRGRVGVFKPQKVSDLKIPVGTTSEEGDADYRSAFFSRYGTPEK